MQPVIHSAHLTMEHFPCQRFHLLFLAVDNIQCCLHYEQTTFRFTQILYHNLLRDQRCR